MSAIQPQDMPENHVSPNSNSEDFESLYTEGLKVLQAGGVVQGVVVQVDENGVMVDIGLKSEGVVPLDEFTEEELRGLSPGDSLAVFVVSIDEARGTMRISREKARRMEQWDHLMEAFEKGIPVEGRIVEKIKGGMAVDLQGVSAFLPGSQLDLRPVANPERFVGNAYRFKILKVNRQRRNLIVSRRTLLELEHQELRAQTLARLTKGAVLEGRVKNITDYGAFVDLGGLDGLLHISDMSWGRLRHPSEKFKTGDRIQVMVLDFSEDTGKVTLGHKQLTPDPWTTITERYGLGRRVRGLVVGLTDYGAFVEIEEGIEGLVHISELKWGTRPRKPSEILSKGQEIEAIVLRLDPSERRVSLSLKQTQPNPWEAARGRYHAGQIIQGKVKNLTDFGAFVQVEEGIDGLIHVSDMSWTRHVRHPSEVLRKGDEVEAVVLSVEPERERMALGLKQLGPDPWISGIPQRIRVGDTFLGRVIKVVEFGVFVELADGVEGLIYSSELKSSDEEAAKPQVGDEVKVRVLKVDTNERKIGLGLDVAAA